MAKAKKARLQRAWFHAAIGRFFDAKKRRKGDQMPEEYAESSQKTNTNLDGLTDGRKEIV